MSGQGWKILLVDDEADFAETISERLQIRGIASRVALSGEAALEKIQEELPDLVVMDVMMPGMGGLAALKQIKKEYPDLPVILLTGQASAKHGIEGQRLGAANYLMKPVQLPDLIAEIRKILEPE